MEFEKNWLNRQFTQVTEDMEQMPEFFQRAAGMLGEGEQTKYVSILRTELDALRIKAEAGNTTHGFNPGDIFAGSAVKVKIHSMLFGEEGLLAIQVISAAVKGKHTNVWSKEQRKFTLNQWQKFIGTHVKEPNSDTDRVVEKE